MPFVFKKAKKNVDIPFNGNNGNTLPLLIMMFPPPSAEMRPRITTISSELTCKKKMIHETNVING